MNEFHKKISSGAITSAINIVVSMAASIVTIPLFLRAVGSEQYGLFTVIASFLGIVSIGDFGITSALTNKVSYLWAEKKEEEISTLFSSGLLLFFGIVLALWGFLFFLFFTGLLSIPALFNAPEGLASVATSVFIILFLFTTIHLLCGGVFVSLYRGLNELSIYNHIQSAYLIIYSVLFIGFLSFGPSLAGIALFQGIGSFFRLALLFAAAKKFFPWLRFFPAGSSMRSIVPLLKQSTYFFVLTLTNAIITRADVFILSHVVGVGAASVYSIGDRIFRLPSTAVQVSAAAMPTISILYQRKEMQALATLYSQILRMNFIFKCTPLLFMLVFSREIIGLWVGESLFGGYALMTVFCISFILYAWVGTQFAFINSMSKQKGEIFPMIMNAVINVGTSIIFGRWWGPAGIALGVVCGNFFTTVLYLPMYLRRFIDIHPLREAFRLIVSFAPPIVLLLGFRYGMMQAVQSPAYQVLFGIIIGCIYVVAVYYIVMCKSERDYIMQKVRGIFARFTIQ